MFRRKEASRFWLTGCSRGDESDTRRRCLCTIRQGRHHSHHHRPLRPIRSVQAQLHTWRALPGTLRLRCSELVDSDARGRFFLLLLFVLMLVVLVRQEAGRRHLSNQLGTQRHSLLLLRIQAL